MAGQFERTLGAVEGQAKYLLKAVEAARADKMGWQQFGELAALAGMRIDRAAGDCESGTARDIVNDIPWSDDWES